MRTKARVKSACLTAGPALPRFEASCGPGLVLLQSFPLTEEEYEAQLQAVADYLNLWEVQERVRAGIRNANKRGPGARGGVGGGVEVGGWGGVVCVCVCVVVVVCVWGGGGGGGGSLVPCGLLHFQSLVCCTGSCCRMYSQSAGLTCLRPAACYAG